MWQSILTGKMMVLPSNFMNNCGLKFGVKAGENHTVFVIRFFRSQ
jgi:hypothetical protein